MQRKILISAAFLTAAVFCAKAQSIRVLNSCYIQPKTFVFVEADAYSTPIKSYTIKSYCPQLQYPDFKVDNVGNYEFDNLPVSDDEEWNWFIETNGKTTKKGTIKNRQLEVQLGEKDRLTIMISPIQEPSTQTVSADKF